MLNTDYFENENDRKYDERRLSRLSIDDLKKELEKMGMDYPRFDFTKENLIKAILEAKYGKQDL